MIRPEEMRPVDVAHAALMEAGRPDLAELIVWFDDEHGGYIEVTDEIVSEPDYVLIDRAETLGREFVGLGPYPREVLS
mgnify:CR=1 FL=1